MISRFEIGLSNYDSNAVSVFWLTVGFALNRMLLHPAGRSGHTCVRGSVLLPRKAAGSQRHAVAAAAVRVLEGAPACNAENTRVRVRVTIKNWAFKMKASSQGSVFK